MNIATKGFDSLAKKLDKIAQISVTEGLRKGASRVEETAKEFVPVDTGNLRDSITSIVEDDRAIVGTNVDYALKIEERESFLSPALQLNKADIQNDIAEDVRKQLGGI